MVVVVAATAAAAAAAVVAGLEFCVLHDCVSWSRTGREDKLSHLKIECLCLFTAALLYGFILCALFLGWDLHILGKKRDGCRG